MSHFNGYDYGKSFADFNDTSVSTVGGKRGVKLENDTVVQLLEKAKAYKIVGRWSMRKAELISAIRESYDKVGKRKKK